MLIEVTEPLEEVARAVPGVTGITSTTSRGSAEMFVDFPWSSDMRQALLSTDAAFAQALPGLPQGTTYEALRMRPTAVAPFLSYALLSDKVDPAELRRIAQYEIAPLLTGIAGVGRVAELGGKTPEVQVSIDPRKLESYGLTLADVTSAVSAANTVKAVGRLEDNDLLYLAVSNNSFTSAASVGEVDLRNAKGGIVRLSDIAKVTMGAVPQWLLVDVNGQPAVTFDVYQQDNTDSLSLEKQIAARLATFMKTQPKAIHLDKWYD
jgi:multidrug efflux pump subunit AcrB